MESITKMLLINWLDSVNEFCKPFKFPWAGYGLVTFLFKHHLPLILANCYGYNVIHSYDIGRVISEWFDWIVEWCQC